MTELYLADTSALVRFYRGQTSAGWDAVVNAGLVGLCEPVRQELLRGAGGKAAFHEMDGLLRQTFPYYPIRESAWEAAAELQYELAQRGWHQCASPVDLLVSVTAADHKLTVLHQDNDFETITRITGQPVRRIG